MEWRDIRKTINDEKHENWFENNLVWVVGNCGLQVIVEKLAFNMINGNGICVWQILTQGYIITILIKMENQVTWGNG